MESSNLEQCVRSCLDDADVPIDMVRTPSGKFNDSYFVQAGARALVLRVAPPDDAVFCFYERDMMRQEPGIHAVLLENTTVPVAPVLAFDDSREVIDRNFILMERLPGAAISDSGPVDANRLLREVGAALRQVHGLTAPEGQYGYLGEHQPMEPQPTWQRAFHVMWNKLIDDIVSVRGYEASEAKAMRRLLEENIALFDRPGPARLLHMDVWAQNILSTKEGALTGLVDWDRALWGDREMEFAVLDYCGISRPAFWEGYGVTRDTSPEAIRRNGFYLLYELQKYIVIRAGRNGDRAAARRYAENSLNMAAQMA